MPLRLAEIHLVRVEHLEEIFEEDLGLVISLGSFFEVSDELFPAFINFLEDLGENVFHAPGDAGTKQAYYIGAVGVVTQLGVRCGSGA